MKTILKLIAVTLVTAIPVLAQQPADARHALTVSDYARAEKWMGYNTNPLVFRSGVRPVWQGDRQFWYRVTTPEGSEFVMVDTAKGTRAPAFDQVKLAAALSAAAGATFDSHRLPFTDFERSADGQTITVLVQRRRWKCDLATYQCTADVTASAAGQRGGGRGGAPIDLLSPDKKRAAFIREFNLWMRDVATGRETQLTTDGVKDFGYATDNAGWTHSDRPVLVWSPDSKKIATFQQDQRGVGEMYLVDTRVGHPQLQAWKYPLPGDEKVTTIQRVIIEVDTPGVIRLKLPPDQHRSTLCDDVQCRGGEWADVEWTPDAKQIAFVSTSRDHKHEQLRIADAATGEIRDVLEETAATQFESGLGRVNWHYLPATNEVVWFSERDGWGQLYLYDATTGKLKNQITRGEGTVTQVLKVDEKNRMLYFLGAGREKGRDPYFSYFYRIGFDGKGLSLLTSEDANHEISLSPSGNFFFDSYSKPDVPPVAVLRGADGKTINTLEKGDISRLVAAGWKPPVPIVVRARDGVTDLYGLMFKPTNLDEKKKYPIVNHIYPGPQGGSVGSRSFSAARRDTQALSELGYIAHHTDGPAKPHRSTQ